MGKITIDGQTYTFEGKHKLLPFALESGVEIPYFCYHPAMSIPTNCRMCLVDVGFQATNAERQPVFDAEGAPVINWGRKPATSCNQDVANGMYVRTNRTSEVIEKAQKGVLEFMLVNHPLDCPICDQAGECPLQINTYKFGPEGSRYELNKVHKPKRIPLGPRVVLDGERCINCTRCVRFTEEISKSDQLTIIARGEKNFPAAAPGKSFDEPYSMNVIDICPVGALTSDDFRFKARVWEMNYTPSVCTGCAKGCSVDVWVRDSQVLRLTPRENQAVNEHWMCDEGRLDYKKYNENRISGAKIKGDVPIDLTEGTNQASELLKKHKGRTLFVASAQASLETNYLFRALANAMGEKTVYYVANVQKGWGDAFLRRDDRSPNTAACKTLGFTEISLDELKRKADGAELVYISEDDRVAGELAGTLTGNSSATLIVHAYNHFAGHDKVALILPAATHIESAGTFINEKNVAQVTVQAKQIARMTPDMWMSMPKSRLEAGGVAVDNWRNPEHAVDRLPGWMLLAQIGKAHGVSLATKTHKELFTALQTEFDVLKGVKISTKNRKESFKMSQFEFALK